jgi:hypothetical protein
MADLTITASDVKRKTGSQIRDGIAGEALSRGELVYEKASDKKLYKADASALATADAVGVAMDYADADDPISYHRRGKYAAGATVAVGTIYVVSATAGGIAPEADILSGEFLTILGIAVSTTEIEVDLDASGVAHA